MSEEQVSNYEMSDEEFMEKGVPTVEEQADTESPVEPSEAIEEEQVSDTTADSPEEPVEAYEEEIEDIDYQGAYEQIFAPFKANGKEMQARTPEEVITLMQMGANYNKKMNGIKKQMPLLKMLEQNDLLDADKLSYLIDLHEKKPEAIAKLVQDSEIDLYDFDAEEQSKSYTPTPRSVPYEQLEVEEVLASIQDSDAYTRTVDVLGNQWDQSSREKLGKRPQLIAAINKHMEDGIYDVIADEVDRLRTMGQLEGVDDLDAYDQVGSMIYGSNKGNAQPQNEVNEKRRRVGSGVKKAAKQDLNAIDILNLPDDEFEKLGNPKFI